MCRVFSLVNPNKTFTSEHECREYDKAFIMIQSFGERANIMSNRAATEGFVDGFINEHRTTQQSIVRNFCKMLTMWSEGKKERLVDARNQCSWDFAKELGGLPSAFPLI